MVGNVPTRPTEALLVGYKDAMSADSAPAVAGVVLAAGAGHRFGAAKQLAPLAGRPLLEHSLLAMARAKLIEERIVVLGAHAEEILAAVELHGARPVLCTSWSHGQGSSLRAAIEALPESVAAVVITLGDQPSIDPRAIDRLVAERDGAAIALRATYDGRPGHPVAFEHPAFAALRELEGDAGGRQLFDLLATKLVACDGLGADRDVDEPSDLAGI
jgi:molybdenum cofactor cytidylyltransferase